DIAGLVKGASRGEGLGNKFLSNIRMTDAIVHVVRCFDDENVIHVEGGADPLRDIDIINIELIMADIEMIERRIEKAKKMGKGDKKYLHEAAVFEELQKHLNDGNSARTFECSEDDMEIIRTSELLTIKPVIYAANMDETTFASGYEDNMYYQAVKKFADEEGSQVLAICAKTEQEIAELPDDEKEMFLEELGIEESGLTRLIKCSYSLLGLISYLTAGSDEVRAWTIKNGTKAPQAAGKIHSDFERGFIRAEVIAFDDLKANGTMTAAREKGLIRSEGKEYVMHDGDIVTFRFNV
ncbi:MAG: redox-regulated ATPase YchF, partial [Oscillospiraceae bacterium]|nr:redox-regulated ATPase YchF [Oscillospiraceae bacterium]